MANTPTAKDKKLTLQQQIEALTAQMHALDQEAVHELKLKLSDAKKVVSTLEDELGHIDRQTLRSTQGTSGTPSFHHR